MFEVKNFDSLIGIEGLSEKLLKNHFKLYQGYIANSNKLLELLNSVDKSKPEFAEMKRRFSWEFNGMRLHELFFDGLTKKPNLNNKSEIIKKIIQDFGSFENWEKDFRAVASMRGIGWTILYYDKESDKLFNVWINEHDVGHLTGAKPLIVVDVFEHAFFTDYETNRANYLDAVLKLICWDTANKRFLKK